MEDSNILGNVEDVARPTAKSIGYTTAERRISIWSTVLCLSYCVKLKADTVEKLIILQYETGRCAS